jgi:hypothetical protein
VCLLRWIALISMAIFSGSAPAPIAVRAMIEFRMKAST